ncbi:MAG: hypothetical protein EA417_22100 [Gammaproteobacteria bacterium]|nr:MAG: hypothetical protein EA417_22100 [Gammaproteobacteria bacterium]
MSFDRLRTNGKRMIPFVLSLSKDAHPRPDRPEHAAGPSHTPPFVLSLSKDADRDALNGKPRHRARLEIRHAAEPG